MMDQGFILFWGPHGGGWTQVSARQFRRSRRAWRRQALDDDAIVATIDDVGLEIYNRRDVIDDPCAYLRRVVAARLHDAYEQSLDPYERAALRARRAARAGLGGGDDKDIGDPTDDEVKDDEVKDDDVGGWALVRYDDEGVGEVADPSGEQGLEAVIDRQLLHARLREAAAGVERWRASEPGRKTVLNTIADIARRTLELLEEDPDALRVCAEGRGGLRLVVLTAMAQVDPDRWGVLPRYELPSQKSVSRSVWKEIHDRYCGRVLDLVRTVLDEALGGGAAEACA